MNITIKRCTADDTELIRALSVSTFSETFSHMNTPENMAAYLATAFAPEKLYAELSDSCSEFWLLLCDGRPAGYLKLNEAPSQSDINDESALEIERIYVCSEFQGSGLGSRLISHALGIAAEKSKKYVWLGVWEKNEKALRFYKNNDFCEWTTHSFRLGDDEQTDIIMKKEL